MTTITSNKNEFNGKIHSSSKNFSEKYEYKQGNGCAGYALLLGLIAVAVVLFTVVIPHLMH